MCSTQDNSHAIEVIKCEECRVEDAMIEFEGRNLCRGCLEAIGWIKGWSKGEDKVRHPCPLCGEPMADFSTMDEMFFHCEDCDKTVVDRNNGIKIVL